MKNRYKHKYNQKIDFLFLYHLNKNYDSDNNYNELKQIYFKNILPSSNQGYEFKKIVKVYKYLLKNKRKRLEEVKPIIESILEINIELGEYKIKKIKDILIKDLPVMIKDIYKQNIDQKYNLEIGLLILNINLKLNKYLPVMFHHNQIKDIKTLIEQNITNDSLMKIIDKISEKSNHYIYKSKKLSTKLVIKKILKQKDIYDKYHIKRI